jgi:hypothetical protein
MPCLYLAALCARSMEKIQVLIYIHATYYRRTRQNMDPLHNIGSSVSKNVVIAGERVEANEERVNISISKRAYDALTKHAKEIIELNPETNKPFTVEEILDEEILLLFSNDWKED